MNITTDVQQPWYSSVPMICVYINATIGLLTFEWAWYTTHRFRQNSPAMLELHSKFPHFRRLDVQNWARWKLWPGALTMMWPRFILASIFGVILWGIAALLLIGQDGDRPVQGSRRGCMRFWYVLFVWLQGVLCWFCCYSYVYEKDVDYSEWLGPSVGLKSADVKDRASMIVSNHTGFLEVLSLISSPLMPAFTPQRQQRNAPILGPITRMLGSVYCDRGGSAE